MSRTMRGRSRTVTFTGNYVVYSALQGPITKGTVFNSVSQMTDYIGYPVVASPLSSIQKKGCITVNGRVDCLYMPSVYGQWFSFNGLPIDMSGQVTTTMPAPSGWYLSVIARTNPSRPVMTPLTLGQDLIDIPKQLRDLGRILTKPKHLLTAKEQASQYLGLQFGWMPLVQDVVQLLDLQSYILKKEKELHRLYSGNGLRRRISMGSTTTESVYNQSWAMLGSDSLITLPISVYTEKKCWATIRWKPLTPPRYGHGYDESINSYARRIVLGLTPEGLAKGTWDIIPWTWLLGWFSNVGSYVLAYSNTVPASHGEACFMSESKVTYKPMSFKYGHLCKPAGMTSSGAFTLRWQTRIVSGAITPGFSVPYLDTFRLSILSALTIQRIPR